MLINNIQVLKTQVVQGKHLNLRIALEKDAEFILELRLNSQLNKFIGKTDPNTEKQREWLRNSYAKESEFHFIIEDKQGTPYGTFAVYDIHYDTGVAEWGRWVIKPNSPAAFPIESTILLLHFAFEKLGLKKLIGGANNQNVQVVNFHKLYASVSSVDAEHTWFYLEEANYIKILKRFKAFTDIRKPG